ncbi:MAG: ferric reductase-like transmembrane domain-containing protein [bacterium]|nr:ferric reductase-like transmembrane domain-containing protein [bacterium]
MDVRNTLIQHLIVSAFTITLVFIFKYLLATPLSTSFGRVSFILLFLILIIGPLMKLIKTVSVSSPLAIPWSWRGELGIWFTLTALTHFILVLSGRPFSDLIKIGGGGFGLANSIGLVALFLAILLAATSFGRIIIFLGFESWRWLHSLTYVVFYLVSAHFIYFQFFSTYGEVGPDWFGYIALFAAMIIIILQLTAFVVVTLKRRS